ncbi:MAG: hypothetical protein QM770_12550 [Tepidisphaeraceae bacterium]
MLSLIPLLAEATTQATEESSIWSKLADAVQGNLFTELIVFSFAIIAVLAYYIKEKYEELQAGKETVVAYRVAQHQRKELTMRSFTNGIPTNLSIIYEIFTKRSYLRRMARVKPEDREPYLDGRSYRQISLAYERDMRLWLLKVQHFTSICTLVQARFDEPSIHRGAEQIRELFEMLVDLTPALPVIADVAERLTKLIDECPMMSGSRSEVDDVRRIIAQQMEASAADGPKFDRTQCMRVARMVALGIDKLFVACTKMMAAELRHEPVKGLLDNPTTQKGLKRKKTVEANAK